MCKWWKSLIASCGSAERHTDARPKDAIDGELLYAAIEQRNVKMVKILLKRGADVNAPCESLRGSTFLQDAVMNRHYEIAKILIEHGADVNMRDKKFMRSPTYHAVNNLDENMTKLMLSSGADLKDVYFLLSKALQLSAIKIAEILLQHNPKFDINATYEDGRTVLLNVIQSPVLTRQKFHGSQFIDFENEDYHKTKLVEFCLSRGAMADSKNIYGTTAIHAALHRGLNKVVEKLLEYGADVDAIDELCENRTPLMTSVLQNRLSEVRSVIKFLPNTEIKDIHGRTALDLAVKYASLSIVRELLDYGADINATFNNGTTPYNFRLRKNSNITILKRHVQKMKVLELYVNPKNSIGLDVQEDFYNDCKKEIEEMKHTKIGDSVASFYDVLTKRMRKLAMYVKNVNISNTLKIVDNYVTIFPIYSGMMRHRFLKSIKLESLLTPSAQSLNSLIGFELPYVVFMELSDYLMNIKDLKNLIKASSTTD